MPREDCSVIVFANDDPLPMVFASLSEAEGYMEGIDVENGLYSTLNPQSGLRGGVYAIDGRVVDVRGAAKNKNWVELEVTSRRDEAGLVELLRSLTEWGVFSSDPADPVAVARELLDQQWESRWPKRPRWLDRRLHRATPPTI